jgi:hypothetical protein
MSAKLKAGWKMSEGQYTWFWRAWQEVCQAQGYDKLSSAEREQQRRDILQELGFSSAKDIDKRGGFDRVKRRFMELSGNIPDPVPPSSQPGDDPGERVRLLIQASNRIGILIKLKSPGWTLAILKDRFHLVDGWNSIDDLSNADLLKLLITVNTRISEAKTKQVEVVA